MPDESSSVEDIKEYLQEEKVPMGLSLEDKSDLLDVVRINQINKQVNSFNYDQVMDYLQKNNIPYSNDDSLDTLKLLVRGSEYIKQIKGYNLSADTSSVKNYKNSIVSVADKIDHFLRCFSAEDLDAFNNLYQN